MKRKQHKLRTDRWIENNKERYAEHKKQYQIDNREWISERSKKHRKENPEHHKKLRKVQYEKHQEKLVEGQRKIRDDRRTILRNRLGGKCVSFLFSAINILDCLRGSQNTNSLL